MASDEQESKGFKVTDRRSFAADTEGDEPASAPREDAPRVEVSGPDAAAMPPLPPVDFQTFVISMASSVLFHLGEGPHPETGEQEVNLPLAKHTIDVLAMLQEKTRGNLNPGEDRLLGTLLYDLRLRYVDAAKHPG
jgi:hypothetical protein